MLDTFIEEKDQWTQEKITNKTCVYFLTSGLQFAPFFKSSGCFGWFILLPGTCNHKFVPLKFTKIHHHTTMVFVDYCWSLYYEICLSFCLSVCIV